MITTCLRPSLDVPCYEKPILEKMCEAQSTPRSPGNQDPLENASKPMGINLFACLVQKCTYVLVTATRMSRCSLTGRKRRPGEGTWS
jgi:hypothetical protein